ncbi:hypothetical protein DSO57_1018920 [Entomophthora muscae]|uniref:Uncharacterized protein n=1 Tax=Entomophthora muscae TaxID=34485 RepID=A0ACC2SH58_9FUNG|nr:hypothetical protein DSO57_1018920 [Entomophthora muscae]
MKTLFDRDVDLWFQFRHTPLVDAMIDTVQTNKFLNVTFTIDEELFTPASFLKTRFYRYMNFYSSYTPPLQEQCPEPTEFIPGLIPEKIALMTNGICFGACTLLVSEVTSLPQVRTFKVGGMAHSIARLASSADNSHPDLTQIIRTLPPNKEPSKYMELKPFASASQLTVPVRMYIHNPGTSSPSEPILAHRHIAHRATSLPLHAWDKISRILHNPYPTVDPYPAIPSDK